MKKARKIKKRLKKYGKKCNPFKMVFMSVSILGLKKEIVP